MVALRDAKPPRKQASVVYCGVVKPARRVIAALSKWKGRTKKFPPQPNKEIPFGSGEGRAGRRRKNKLPFGKNCHDSTNPRLRGPSSRTRVTKQHCAWGVCMCARVCVLVATQQPPLAQFLPYKYLTRAKKKPLSLLAALFGNNTHRSFWTQKSFRWRFSFFGEQSVPSAV